MNVNSPPPPPSIRDWLKQAVAELKQIGISSPRLDAEIILAHTLRKSRTYLHAHLDERLSRHHYEIADARLELRRDRTPIAYIIGHKEFYGRNFRVSPATLIPRPESEDMITLLKELEVASPAMPLLQASAPHLVDVGTGTGCLGVTVKLEIPELDVMLLDSSRHALKVADLNARHLGADVVTARSDLLTSYPLTADYILANLPYVSSDWERSLETNHEPSEALFADNNGTYFILKLLAQAPAKLNRGGFLLLEADPRQHQTVASSAKYHGFTLRESRGFILCFQKS